MIRTQIQLPDPLHRRIKEIAKMRDWSIAEVVRRGLEEYEATCPRGPVDEKTWSFPKLRPSGGYVADPANVRPEMDAIDQRSK